RRAAPKAKCGATNAHPICEQHTSASLVFVAQTASLSVSPEIVAAREDFFNHGWTRINTDEDGFSLIRVHPCSSVVGSYWFWLRPETARAANCAAPTFMASSTNRAGSNPVFVTAGDLNGDGKLDLAVANQFSGNVSVLLGRGDGTFQAATNAAAGSSPTSVAV